MCVHLEGAWHQTSLQEGDGREVEQKTREGGRALDIKWFFYSSGSIAVRISVLIGVAGKKKKNRQAFTPLSSSCRLKMEAAAIKAKHPLNLIGLDRNQFSGV